MFKAPIVFGKPVKSVLTSAQKDCLSFITQNPKLPIPWHQLTHIDSVGRQSAIDGLVNDGLIDSRHALNMRGICHLVVDCNMPFTEILKIYPNAFRNMANEIAQVRKILPSDDHANIYFYYTFKQVIEWDLFDASHNIADLKEKEAIKSCLEVASKLLDDGRIGYDKILMFMNVPVRMTQDQKISKEQVKYAIEMYKGYL